VRRGSYVRTLPGSTHTRAHPPRTQVPLPRGPAVAPRRRGGQTTSSNSHKTIYLANHIYFPVMPHRYIHNRIELKTFRKSLRNNSTLAEAILWKHIKGRQLNGRKFRRQHSIGSYILDFYCPEEKLAIELDGAHHFTPEGLAHDEKRTHYLNSLNIKVLRFENDLILHNTPFVLAEIKKHLTPTSP
jgi:very-short-patch-repair endonuclease